MSSPVTFFWCSNTFDFRGEGAEVSSSEEDRERPPGVVRCGRHGPRRAVVAVAGRGRGGGAGVLAQLRRHRQQRRQRGGHGGRGRAHALAPAPARGHALAVVGLHKVSAVSEY